MQDKVSREEGLPLEENSGSNQRQNQPNLSPLLTERPANQKLLVKCTDCGIEFEAYDLGRWTRRTCEQCVQVARAAQQEIELEAQRRLQESRKRARIDAARIPATWRNTRFETADPNINKAAFITARKYATDFHPQTSPSLVLFSKTNGTGKTFLAACIANHVLYELGYSVLFQKARDLMLDIRQTFSDRGETEAGILNRVTSFDLLVLDDVGIDTPSDWLFSTYWTVFDRRLESGLPLVVTTNHPLMSEKDETILEDRIGSGAASRLRQMCSGHVVKLPGKDLR